MDFKAYQVNQEYGSGYVINHTDQVFSDFLIISSKNSSNMLKNKLKWKQMLYLIGS